MRLSLRIKVLLVALVLAVIPWLGYLHIRQMEALLLEGQEQALLATARAIATALHDRPELLAARPGAASSGEMERILRSLGRSESRIWIVDQNQRLLAIAGDLKRELPEQSPSPAGLDLAVGAVRPVMNLLLKRPGNDFDDALPVSEIAGGAVASSALQGVPGRRWRQSADARAVILSASHPVWDGDRIVAAVVAEETTNGVRSVYNGALEQLVALTLLAFLVGALTLLAFASRLSTRLRRLRDEAEAAIDSQGRVRKLIAGSRAQDEIGDLSRSFSTVLDRLAQYNQYLESMAGRLSHELRTPVAVVRSSLENLSLDPAAPDARTYIDRAEDGLRRLDAILTRMSEATRLEQIVRQDERETFDARAVVTGCVGAYASLYPAKKFDAKTQGPPLMLDGSADLYAQLLDKLVANAVDFSTGEEPISVRLENAGGSALLTVSNRGARLPKAMAGKLFESMVSVRRDAAGGEPHLGLGLYIVRLIAEFHGGRAEALNRADGTGVEVRVACPLAG